MTQTAKNCHTVEHNSSKTSIQHYKKAEISWFFIRVVHTGPSKSHIHLPNNRDVTSCMHVQMTSWLTAKQLKCMFDFLLVFYCCDTRTFLLFWLKFHSLSDKILGFYISLHLSWCQKSKNKTSTKSETLDNSF